MPILSSTGSMSIRGFSPLNQTPTRRFAQSLTNTNYYCQIKAVEIAPDNCIYTVGNHDTNTGSVPKAFISKSSPTGDILWQKFLGVSQDKAIFTGVVISRTDNYVYTCGHGRIINTSSFQGLICKYNRSNGSLVWQKRLYTNSYSIQLNAIAIDNSDNIYVTGSILNSSGYDNMIVAKYEVNGTLLWQQYINHTSSAHTSGKGIAVNSVGEVYVVGDAASNYANISKYSSSGVLQWSKAFLAGSSYYAGFYGATVDSSDNVLVSGYEYAQGMMAGRSPTVIKFNSAGSILWQKRLTNNEIGHNEKIYVNNATASIYAVGNWIYNSRYNGGIVSYDSNGNLLWKYILAPDITSRQINFFNLTVNSSNSLYAVGFSNYATENGLLLRFESASTRPPLVGFTIDSRYMYAEDPTVSSSDGSLFLTALGYTNGTASGLVANGPYSDTVGNMTYSVVKF